MIRNFNHAMSSGISIGTGAGSEVRGETWSGVERGGPLLPARHLGELLRRVVVVEEVEQALAELAENHQNV